MFDEFVGIFFDEVGRLDSIGDFFERFSRTCTSGTGVHVFFGGAGCSSRGLLNHIVTEGGSADGCHWN